MRHAAGSSKTVLTVLRGGLYGLFDAVFPRCCIGCNEIIEGERGDLCDRCTAGLDEAAAVFSCPKCGRSVHRMSVIDGRCRGCRSEATWNIRELVRIGEYTGLLRDSIIRLKHIGEDADARLLGGRLAAAIATRPWASELEMLVPVPMHRMRRWQRPCDHALVLAQAVSHSLSRRLGRRLPVRSAAVWRKHYSPSQTYYQTRNERFENVKDCFEATKHPGVEGKTICIIDNIVVSGATLHELSKVLRKAGARRIYAAVAARSALAGDARIAAPPLAVGTQSPG